jgi:hypothetical protein
VSEEIRSPATPLSEHRARLLKYALWSVLLAAMLMAGFGVTLLVMSRTTEDAQQADVLTLFAVFLLTPSALMLPASAVSLRFVPFRGRGAKAGGATTGVLTALVAVPFLRGYIGLPLLALGLTTVYLAVWPEKRRL